MNVYDILNIFLVLYILIFLFKDNDTMVYFSKFTKVKKVNSNLQGNNLQSNNLQSNNLQGNKLQNRYLQDDSQRDIDNAILKKQLNNRDNNVVDDKLTAPERRHEREIYRKVDGLKINEHTRGEPDSYQLIGLLHKDNVDKKYQLFGRRTYPGSPEWEYYIGGRDSGGLDYKFQLNTNQEIYDNTTIINPVDGEEYNVKIYNFDIPRYIPYVS